MSANAACLTVDDALLANALHPDEVRDQQWALLVDRCRRDRADAGLGEGEERTRSMQRIITFVDQDDRLDWCYPWDAPSVTPNAWLLTLYWQDSP